MRIAKVFAIEGISPQGVLITVGLVALAVILSAGANAVLKAGQAAHGPSFAKNANIVFATCLGMLLTFCASGIIAVIGCDILGMSPAEKARYDAQRKQANAEDAAIHKQREAEKAAKELEVSGTPDAPPAPASP